MSIIVATSTALVIWIVLWSVGQKALDASLLALTIVLVAATARTLLRHLPGRNP